MLTSKDADNFSGMPPRRLDFDTAHLPALRAFLADLVPEEELAYRFALRGMFARFGNGEWRERIEELLAVVVRDENDLLRVLRLSDQIQKVIAPKH